LEAPALKFPRFDRREQMTALRRQVNPFEFMCSTIGIFGVLLTIPVVIAVAAPMTGWGLGAVLFLGSWILAMVIGRFAGNLDSAQAIGITGMSFMVRAWLVFGILFVVAAKGDKTVGLTAAGVFLAGFTLDLMGRTMLHALHSKQRAEGIAE
jgi:uncharacterized membrane protein (DUF485 family)